MQGTYPLKTHGLSRSYGSLQALSDFDLTVKPGECVALIGHNGSGKTTAVRMIAGLLEPSGGTVEVCGADVHSEPAAIKARASMAVVPDTPMLYADLTVAEHLELVALAHGVADEDLDQRISEILLKLGLQSKSESLPGELSRGMRQKVALACALIRPYRLLVLDEPVVGLDPPAQQMLREMLIDAKHREVAVVMTTHQLGFGRGIADRAVLLAEGVVVEQGDYESLTSGSGVYERGLR